MKAYFYGSILLLFLFTSACNSLTAKAELINSKGEPVGTATLTAENDGVKVLFHGENLPPGEHAFHIHEKGVCTKPDFNSAGGHYNPEQKQHGKENPNGHHVGDLKNITVNEQGQVKVEQSISNASLDEAGQNSLFKEGGTAIVIHEKADDYQSDPSGAAGKRIACGVITAQ